MKMRLLKDEEAEFSYSGFSGQSSLSSACEDIINIYIYMIMKNNMVIFK